MKSIIFSKILQNILENKFDDANNIMDEIRPNIKGLYEKKLFNYIKKILTPDEELHFQPETLPSGRPWPKISVITPSYNQGIYIEETIKSVIDQKYPNLEYILIDGGSTDETVSVIKKYEEYFTYWVSEKDSGQSNALNKGFNKATGEIFCWLNSDDQFAERALLAVALAFDIYKVDIVSGICDIYQDNVLVNRHQSSCSDGPLPLNDLLDLEKGWNAGQFFYQPEVFFTKKLWEKCGSHVREDCFYSMDYELWCRFGYAGASLHVISKSLTKFRMHDQQKTASIDGFKSELIKVRDRFALERNIKILASERPDFDWNRKLNIKFINDNEFKYGAGIAHKRMLDAFSIAGHNVRYATVPDAYLKNYDDKCEVFINEILSDECDLFIFGNLHAKNSCLPDFFSKLSQNAPIIFITHDFWLFTGRCAYTGSCTQYLTGCSEACETQLEYPKLEGVKIAEQWKNKNNLLNSKSSPIIAANSKWSYDFISNIKKSRGLNSLKINRFKLGVNTEKFKPLDKIECKKLLNIPVNDFVIVFSFSSFSEKRKGGDILLSALNKFNVKNVTLLLIGNSDIDFEISGKNVVKLGYLENQEIINSAFSAGDIYVGPSTQETFGQVFIEAAACGTASIGFYGSGVEDAIKDGVTGLLVEPNHDNLLLALEKVYYDSKLLKSLHYFSRLFVINEFSLESIYKSFFEVLKDNGLVDKFKIPHKISFDKIPSEKDDENYKNWIPEAGISFVEGPYPPEYDFRFQWCYSRSSILKYNFKTDSKALKITICNPIFKELQVEVIVSGVLLGTIKLIDLQQGVIVSTTFSLPNICGWQEVKLISNQVKIKSNDESRDLSFMLVNIEAAS